MNGTAVSTKTRILDAAERFFASEGLDRTSLRDITAEAGVNLAAINYHFQSKERLIDAVIARRMGPANQERLRLLDAYEAEAAGNPVPLEQLLRAFLQPLLFLKQTDAKNFVPLIGRIYTERSSFVERVFRENFQEVARRFAAAFERALPRLPRQEVIWRLHFILGALLHVLAAGPLIRASSGGLCDPDDGEAIMARLIQFFEAALLAPAAAPETQHAP